MTVKGLSKKYNNHRIYEDFSFFFEEGFITTILGPSGCGKTTLLRILCGLETADKPFINNFKDKTISYIFQEPRLLPWKTAKENIAVALGSVYTKTEAENIAKRYISLVKLSGFEDHYPGALSGGMMQRVAIAGAFAYPSDILFMDEPFKGLDHKLKYELISLFLRLWEQDRRTVLFITHCPEEAKLVSHRTLTLGLSPKRFIRNERRSLCSALEKRA